MDSGVRSYLTAGVTLVTASAIAVSVIVPQAPADAVIRAASPAVQLAARPFDAYAEVFEPLSAPSIAIQEAVRANAELFGAAVAAGEPIDEAIVKFVLQPAINLATGPAEVVADFWKEAANSTIIPYWALLLYLVPVLVVAPYWPAYSLAVVAATVLGSGAAYQGRLISEDLSDAVGARDWLDVAYVLAEAPARLTYGALWGDPDLVSEGFVSGLLSGLPGAGQTIADWLAPDVLQEVQLARSTAQPTATADAEAFLGRLTEGPAFMIHIAKALGTAIPPSETPARIADAVDPPVAVQLPAGPEPASTLTVEIAQKMSVPAESTAEHAAKASTVIAPDAVTENDTPAIADAIEVRESRKAEARESAKDPRKADRPKPFKKIRDSIGQAVADARDAAKTASDRHDRPGTNRSNRSTSSKNESAAGPSTASGVGQKEDSDRGSGKGRLLTRR